MKPLYHDENGLAWYGDDFGRPVRANPMLDRLDLSDIGRRFANINLLDRYQFEMQQMQAKMIGYPYYHPLGSLMGNALGHALDGALGNMFSSPCRCPYCGK